MGSGYSAIRKSAKLQHSEKEVSGLGLSGTQLISCGTDVVKLWDLKTGECLHTMKGHKDRVFSAGIQGETLGFSGSADHTVKLWSLMDGSCVRTLTGHSGDVVAVVSNGDHIFSSSTDQTIRQWDIEAGVLVRAYTGHTGPVNSIDVVDKKLVSGSDDKTVRVWDTTKESGLCSVLRRHTGSVTSVTWVGNDIGSGSSDLSVCLWDTTVSACSRQFDAGGNVRVLDSVQQYLVAGAYVASISIFDTEKRKHLKTINSQRTAWLESLACNSEYLVTGDKRGVIRVYCYEGKLNRQMEKENKPANSAPSSPSHAKTMKYIDLDKDAQPTVARRSYTESPQKSSLFRRSVLTDAPGTPTKASLLQRIQDRKSSRAPSSAPTTPQKKRELAAIEPDLLLLPAPAAARPTSSAPLRPTTSLTFEPELLLLGEPALAVATSSAPSPAPRPQSATPRKSREYYGRLRRSGRTSPTMETERSSEYSLPFDVSGPETPSGSHIEKKKQVINHGKSVTSLELSDNTVISGGEDNMIKLWNLENGDLVETLEGHTGPVMSLSLGSRFLVSGGDTTVRLWDIKKMSCTKTLTNKKEVTAVMCKFDQLISASTDRTIKLWDYEKGTCLHSFDGHTDDIKSLDLTETLIASASLDKTVRIWDVRTKQCVNTFKGHAGPVNAITFANDGETVISGSSDMSACIWDLKLAVPSHKLSAQGNVRALSVLGTRLIVGSYVGTIKIFETERGKCLKTLTAQCNWLETLKSTETLLITGDRKGEIASFSLGADGPSLMSKLKSKLTSLSRPSSRTGTDSDPPTPVLEPKEPKDLSFIMEDERESDFSSFTLSPNAYRSKEEIGSAKEPLLSPSD